MSAIIDSITAARANGVIHFTSSEVAQSTMKTTNVLAATSYNSGGGNVIKVHSTFEATLGGDSTTYTVPAMTGNYTKTFVVIPGISSSVYRSKMNRPHAIIVYFPTSRVCYSINGNTSFYLDALASRHLHLKGGSITLASLGIGSTGNQFSVPLYIGFDTTNSYINGLFAGRSGAKVKIVWFDMEYDATNTNLIYDSSNQYSNDISLDTAVTVNNEDLSATRVLMCGGATANYIPGVNNTNWFQNHIKYYDAGLGYTNVGTDTFTISNDRFPDALVSTPDHLRVDKYGIRSVDTYGQSNILVGGVQNIRAYRSHFISNTLVSQNGSTSFSGDYHLFITCSNKGSFLGQYTPSDGSTLTLSNNSVDGYYATGYTGLVLGSGGVAVRSVGITKSGNTYTLTSNVPSSGTTANFFMYRVIHTVP